MVGIPSGPLRRRVGSPAKVAAGLTLALIASGCSTDPAPRSLEGTSWQLAVIESMNDAQGATPVPESTPFTVSFGTDGTATFGFDCNRGTGSYEAAPTGDGETGTLTFGTIAVTEMGCPSPSLDREIGAALPNVRGYIFRNDQLHMSLMFDGGILSWNPA